MNKSALLFPTLPSLSELTVFHFAFYPVSHHAYHPASYPEPHHAYHPTSYPEPHHDYHHTSCIALTPAYYSTSYLTSFSPSDITASHSFLILQAVLFCSLTVNLPHPAVFFVLIFFYAESIRTGSFIYRLREELIVRIFLPKFIFRYLFSGIYFMEFIFLSREWECRYPSVPFLRNTSHDLCDHSTQNHSVYRQIRTQSQAASP